MRDDNWHSDKTIYDPEDPSLYWIVPTKRCSWCYEFKTYHEFYEDNSENSDGAQSYCKECDRKRVKRHYDEYIKGRVRTVTKEYKRCIKCEERKPVSEFNRHNRNEDGLASSCRPCQRKYQRERYRKITGR